MFKKHGNLEYHKTALLKSDNFLNIHLNKSSSIINRIDSERHMQGISILLILYKSINLRNIFELDFSISFLEQNRLKKIESV